MNLAGSAFLVLLTLTLSTPAGAVCIIGMGGTCPITDDESAKLLRPSIDGIPYGSPFHVGKKLFYSINKDETERVLAILNEGRDCENGLRGIQVFLTGTYALTDDVCKQTQLLIKLGLVSLRLDQHLNSLLGMREWHINVDLTEIGKSASKGVLAGQTESFWELAPSTLKFLRIIRSMPQYIAGQSATYVQFEYEIVPNVWGQVQKLVPGQGLPTQRKIGQAVFQQWSDGWHLATEPSF